MVEYPSIERDSDGAWMVWTTSRVRCGRDWRFMGWLLLGVGAAFVLYDIQRWQFNAGPAHFLLLVLDIVIGTMLVRGGGGFKWTKLPLLRLSSSLDGTHLQSYALESMSLKSCEDEPRIKTSYEPRDIEPSGITHVVFGLVDLPWPGRSGVNVEAFALYLALQDGTPVPVIDGTLEKLDAYKIATTLAELLGVPLIELGKGQN